MNKTRIALLALALLLVVSMLVSCGGKPDDISEKAYNNAVDAIKAVDLYLDGKLTDDELDYKLFTCSRKADSIADDANEEREKSGDILGSTYTRDLGISISISNLKLHKNSYTELKEARDELADKINY